MPLVKVNMLAGKTPEFKKTLFQKFNATFDVSFEFFVGEFWVAGLSPDFAGKL